MPARGQTDPNSLRSRVRAWFDTHPGMHRCQDVAAALGEQRTWAVANECNRLQRDGLLARHKVRVPGRKVQTKVVTYYASLAEGTRPAAFNREETRDPTDPPQTSQPAAGGDPAGRPAD